MSSFKYLFSTVARCSVNLDMITYLLNNAREFSAIPVWLGTTALFTYIFPFLICQCEEHFLVFHWFKIEIIIHSIFKWSCSAHWPYSIGMCVPLSSFSLIASIFLEHHHLKASPGYCVVIFLVNSPIAAKALAYQLTPRYVRCTVTTQ